MRLVDAVAFYKRQREPYRIEQTGSSVSILSNRFAMIIADTMFQPWHMAMLSRVKAEVRRNADKIAGLPESDGQSFAVNVAQFPKRIGRRPVDELDLVAAYLQTAIRLELISEETAAKLSRYPKRWRLRILGAIASRKRIDSYDQDGRKIGTEYKCDAALRHCWFVIVGNVDKFNDLLRDCVGPRFIFSWYDNFYCEAGALTPRLQRAITVPHKITRTDLHWRRTPNLILAMVGGRRRFYLPAPDLTAMAR